MTGSAPFVGIRAGCDKQCPPCYRDVSARCASQPSGDDDA